jgi:hypothetical protein
MPGLNGEKETSAGFSSIGFVCKSARHLHSSIICDDTSPSTNLASPARPCPMTYTALQYHDIEHTPAGNNFAIITEYGNTALFAPQGQASWRLRANAPNMSVANCLIPSCLNPQIYFICSQLPSHSVGHPIQSALIQCFNLMQHPSSSNDNHRLLLRSTLSWFSFLRSCLSCLFCIIPYLQLSRLRTSSSVPYSSSISPHHET